MDLTNAFIKAIYRFILINWATVTWLHHLAFFVIFIHFFQWNSVIWKGIDIIIIIIPINYPIFANLELSASTNNCAALSIDRKVSYWYFQFQNDQMP